MKGEQSSDNPWESVSLEWQIESPPTTHNFHDIPKITSAPYNYGEVKH